MGTLVVFMLLIWILSLFLFSLPKVSGYGMSPTLNHNERVFVNKRGTIKRFSLVYMKIPNKGNERTIRRVIGLPGEELRYKNDQLWIGSEAISERFLVEKKRSCTK